MKTAAQIRAWIENRRDEMEEEDDFGDNEDGIAILNDVLDWIDNG